MAEVEIWKDIPECQGYQASNLGRIRSLDRIIVSKNGKKMPFKGKVLVPYKERRNGRPGYLYVGFNGHYRGNYKHFTIHKLVALTFLGPRPPGLLVLHKNDNPYDNRVENLRYGTGSENWSDSIALGKRNRGNSKLTSEQVAEIRKAFHDEMQRLRKQYGVSLMTIREIIGRKTWSWVDAEDT